MSLRVRLNILITLCFALVLLFGSVFVVNNARHAVHEELTSTANLTIQLIEVALALADNGPAQLPPELLDRIVGLGGTRHLDVEIYHGGRAIQDRHVAHQGGGSADAPAWFAGLVGQSPIEFRRVLSFPDRPAIEIVVRADPSDEIGEAWNEVGSVLGLLVLFIVLANLLVYFTIGRWLAPVAAILKALDGIEQGDYRLRLPRFPLPELSRISEKFNHMAEVLLRSREENRALTQRSLAIQERERRNLAHELHDELGQSISAVKAVAVSMSQQSDTRTIGDNAAAIVSISNHMYDVARQMMRRLRPVVLDELGLIAALQEMVDDWNARHGEVFCRFRHSGDLDGLGEEINIGLYRIVQESLTNISKHAGATEVDIRLAAGQVMDGTARRIVELKIRDDGLGFDPEQTRFGLGLLGMRERVEAMRGKFSLVTKPGQGVSISLSIPVNGSEARHDG